MTIKTSKNTWGLIKKRETIYFTIKCWAFELRELVMYFPSLSINIIYKALKAQ